MVIISIIYQLCTACMVIFFLIMSANASISCTIRIQLKYLLHNFEVCTLMLLLSAAMVRQIVASFVSLKCFAQAVLPCEMRVARAWKFVMYVILNRDCSLFAVLANHQQNSLVWTMDLDINVLSCEMNHMIIAR